MRDRFPFTCVPEGGFRKARKNPGKLRERISYRFLADAEIFVVGALPLLVLSFKHADDVVSIGDKVLAALRQPFALPEREVSVTASLGVAFNSTFIALVIRFSKACTSRL